MQYTTRQIAAASVLSDLRTATRGLHEALESRFDAIAELSDDRRRPLAIQRYAQFYTSAHAALHDLLADVRNLSFSTRAESWLALGASLPLNLTAPGLTRPETQAEALGALYVVEGSVLGGRIIQRTLRSKGINDPGLNFLDPYGEETGRMWRGLIEVIEQAGAQAPAERQAICRGAVRGFQDARRILCGDPL
ncbi:biliverdin-producing heme oxygenase [Falsigemmobacter faecalis]|uniref:biliverdin-producing heme oxygenase n=1 Tax=Falsigemmobacter faecalis TaxID=2488730 RepID=UPI001315AB9A|nr:biliverdin-producing heme oxygenase [Falsigemmobacter faecalis]